MRQGPAFVGGRGRLRTRIGNVVPECASEALVAGSPLPATTAVASAPESLSSQAQVPESGLCTAVGARSCMDHGALSGTMKIRRGFPSSQALRYSSSVMDLVSPGGIQPYLYANNPM